MKFLALFLAGATSVSISNNQDHLYELMELEDAPAQIHQYRNHAYNDEQYFASHPEDYKADAPVGYLSPITGNHGLAQTYPIADSASYIDPYNQRDHAWNDAQYDVSNETHWVLGSPRGSHLNVSRPLYHEIVGGSNANTTEAYGGYDNHWSEPTSFMMTMAEALEAYGL